VSDADPVPRRDVRDDGLASQAGGGALRRVRGTASRVVEMLGEDEDWLNEISNKLDSACAGCEKELIRNGNPERRA
jgi:hypothetical protein